MTPEEFYALYDEMKAELVKNTDKPELINDVIVSCYIQLQFKKSAQEGLFKCFQELNNSVGAVLAAQTKDINANTAELISFLMEKIVNIEKKLNDLSN